MQLQEQHEGILAEEDPPDTTKEIQPISPEEYYETPNARKRAILTFCEGGTKKYCFVKEFLRHAGLSDEIYIACCNNHEDGVMCLNQQRVYNGDWTTFQLGQFEDMIEFRKKEVEKECRYLPREDAEKKITYDEAMKRWVEQGYAAKYRARYNSCKIDTHHMLESTLA